MNLFFLGFDFWFAEEFFLNFKSQIAAVLTCLPALQVDVELHQTQLVAKLQVLQVDNKLQLPSTKGKKME